VALPVAAFPQETHNGARKVRKKIPPGSGIAGYPPSLPPVPGRWPTTVFFSDSIEAFALLLREHLADLVFGAQSHLFQRLPANVRNEIDMGFALGSMTFDDITNELLLFLAEIEAA